MSETVDQLHSLISFDSPRSQVVFSLKSAELWGLVSISSVQYRLTAQTFQLHVDRKARSCRLSGQSRRYPLKLRLHRVLHVFDSISGMALGERLRGAHRNRTGISYTFAQLSQNSPGFPSGLPHSMKLLVNHSAPTRSTVRLTRWNGWKRLEGDPH